MTSIDKWVALPPKTPVALVDVYRATYAEAMRAPEFVELGQKISEDFTPMSWSDVDSLVRRIGATRPEAINFIATMLRKQGLETD